MGEEHVCCFQKQFDSMRVPFSVLFLCITFTTEDGTSVCGDHLVPSFLTRETVKRRSRDGPQNP